MPAAPPALVALAEAHARAGRADRTIVFLAVTAEESGLLGSAYYAANPIYPARADRRRLQHGFAEHGRRRARLRLDRRRQVGARRLSRPRRRRAPGLRVSAEPTPEAGYYFRSDQFSLAKQGVPMLYGRGGEDLVNGGPAAGRAAAQDYRANRYHGVDDEYDPDWDWAGRAQRRRHLLPGRPRAGDDRATGRTGSPATNSAPSATASRAGR